MAVTRSSRLILTALVAALGLLLGCDFSQLETPPPPPPEQSIVIDPNPDEVAAGWDLAGPGGPFSGAGDSTLIDMELGTYVLTWEDTIAGYTPPTENPDTNTLTSGGVVTFRATYVRIVEGIELLPVSTGTFWMGSPAGELGSSEDERPQHQVSLFPVLNRVRPFYIATTEVTQAQWQEVMVVDDPSWFAGCWECPVENVSWYDAVDFCNALSDREGLERAYFVQGDLVIWDRESPGYRLPTEAEWEYACRADTTGGSGGTTAFYSGGISVTGCGADPNLELVGWYCANSDGITQVVGQKDPNGRLLYDLHGNVWEWCWDQWGEYNAGLERNPTGSGSGPFRVIRGGSWLYGAQRCRSASRRPASPASAASDLGFRVARYGRSFDTVPQPPDTSSAAGSF